MRRIGHIAAVHLARGDHVDGQVPVLHDMHLHAGGLGAQQHVGLAVSVSLGMRNAAGVVVDHIERVASRAARVIHGAR